MKTVLREVVFPLRLSMNRNFEVDIDIISKKFVSVKVVNASDEPYCR